MKRGGSEEYERIYLTGFMGSGKSTVGPLLADRLGWSFDDLDDRIVEIIGMPIADFFKVMGEAEFRALESMELRATEEDRHAVIAVGGGALCNESSLQWALEHGLVVYLKVRVEELTRRLKEEQITRPMLLGKDGSLQKDEVVGRQIASLLNRREAFYSRAHLTIEAEGAPAGDIAAGIVQAIQEKRDEG